MFLCVLVLCNGMMSSGVNLTILPSMVELPYDEYARVIIEEKVSVVETAGSNPKKWIGLFKNAGLITIHKCVAIRHALSAQRLGVDIISLVNPIFIIMRITYRIIK